MGARFAKRLSLLMSRGASPAGRWARGLAVAVAALGLASCARHMVETGVGPGLRAAPAPYTIGKNDLLDVIVWKEPQLSGKVRVIADGTVTLPLTGPVPAEGLSCSQLQTALTGRLAQYTHNPNVTVRVADPASQVFYILGEVRKPGSYPLRADEVLSQALAQAGGFTEFADEGGIRIVRRTHERASALAVDFRQVTRGDLRADIPLQAGDTVTVP